MRVGLLGCGNVSPQYAIGLGLFPGVELVACADLDGPRAEALAAQHGMAALSPAELIGGDAVGILVNISPGMAHVEVSSAALPSRSRPCTRLRRSPRSSARPTAAPTSRSRRRASVPGLSPRPPRRSCF